MLNGFSQAAGGAWARDDFLIYISRSKYSILRKRHWNVIVGAATLPLVQRPRNPVLDTHLRCQNDLLFLGSCCFTMALVLQARYDDGD